jgi:hypothetical protein
MMCRIARRYGVLPHVVARFPWRYYVAVRNEMVQEWVDRARAVQKQKNGGHGEDRVVDMTPKDLKRR